MVQALASTPLPMSVRKLAKDGVHRRRPLLQAQWPPRYSLNGTRVANIEANEVVFSFEGYYTQLDRIRAWRGTLPDNGDRVFNDPDGPPITGFRVR